MNKIWILLLVTHGCVSEKVSTKAYETEAEYNNVLNDGYKKVDLFTEVRGQCESADAMLEETKGKD